MAKPKDPPHGELQPLIDRLEGVYTQTGIDAETFKDWLANDPEFQDAFESGQPLDEEDY